MKLPGTSTKLSDRGVFYWVIRVWIYLFSFPRFCKFHATVLCFSKKCKTKKE